MNYFKNKKKKVLFFITLILVSFFVYIFVLVGDIVRYGYDKQNKAIETIKSIISPHYIKKIRDNVFIISNLKKKNEFLELQVKKYEQGNEGQKFDTQTVELNGSNYELNFFFLPFKRLDVNLGWNAELNSLRAHYAEINNENVFSISGEGKTVYFNKKNLLKNSLKIKDLPNNINEILEKNNFELIGIRDLYFHNNQILISMQTRNEKGITINLYKADLNFKKINFQIFFETKEYWEQYNVFSGGRIEKFDDENILFSVGFSAAKDVAQEMNRLLGKIININLESKEHKIVSIGHRNPQGLRYLKGNNLIINSEHGPKGGDEINLIKLNEKNIPNYGWPIASYGEHYDQVMVADGSLDEYPLLKSHKNNGFIEPLKYFVPSIGISEIISLNNDKSYVVSSMRDKSLYFFNLDNNNQIEKIQRVEIGERIRDLMLYKNKVIMFLENTVSIGIVE